jgi:poly(A) polymerase/tRNA nucleotidyltransferase (CCA-adding enzyme)
VLAALPGARAVGGCVRDALAGREVHDVDIAAPLPPEAIAERLRGAGLKVFETGLAHGTVTAVLDRQPVEVTALRRDVATDGRHAEVAWTTDWREDAARRDFRINAMSCDAAGHLWDYHGGREDLDAGRVRFVGDAATRLREDYLRGLRFFRFWARYGRGAPDADAVAAIRDAVEGLRRRIAPERIWMELKRLLEAPDPVEAIELMEATGIRDAVLPEGAAPTLLRTGIARGLPRDPLLRLAVLVPAEAAESRMPDRLRWSREEAERYRAARADLPLTPTRRRMCSAACSPTIRSRRSPTPPGCGRRAASRATGPRSAPASLRPTSPSSRCRGRDLLAAGLPPGPEYGRILARLRAWWLDGGCTATREDLLHHLASGGRRGVDRGPWPALPSTPLPFPSSDASGPSTSAGTAGCWRWRRSARWARPGSPRSTPSSSSRPSTASPRAMPPSSGCCRR